MTWNNRVVWSEGMFLRTQHFQQLDRYVDHQLKRRTENLAPYGWGVELLQTNTDLLASGKFAVTTCRGVMPDGSPFSIPEDASPPPPLEVPDGARGKLVYLTLPISQPGGIEILLEERGDMIARFAKRDVGLVDTVAGFDTRTEIQIAEPRLRYLLEGTDLGGLTTIPIARVVEVRADRSVVLDDQFIAPCLSLAAQPILAGFAIDIEGRLNQRAEALAARVAGGAGRGVGEIADLLLLQLVNRNFPLIHHFAGSGSSYHPERLYCVFVELAGELATYTAESKRAGYYPEYRHDDLQASFGPVMADLRRSLGIVLAPTAISIPLEKKRGGFQIAIVADTRLFQEATFVLALRSSMAAEEVAALVPNQIKFGPGGKIWDLVNLALPGVRTRQIPPPRQLPYAGNTLHFELHRGDPLWRDVSGPSGVGGLALHVSDKLSDVELELWAIRDTR